MIRRFVAVFLLCLISFSFREALPVKETPQVDIVFCLDLSASTSGLIEELKANFWDIVQEFNKYSPKPNLRIGIIGAGRIYYKKENDYVSILCPLTENIDQVANSIYSLENKIHVGKPNNVNTALETTIKKINWSKEESALKLVYVIGNGPIGHAKGNAFDVTERVSAEGIIVNSIFCVNEKNGAEIADWRDLAKLGGGHFFVLNPAAPIIFFQPGPTFGDVYKLNARLNDTYVDIMPTGENKKTYIFLDSAAMRIHPMVFIARVAFKASPVYKGTNARWDLAESESQEPVEYTFGEYKGKNVFDKKDKTQDPARTEQALKLKKERQEIVLNLKKSLVKLKTSDPARTRNQGRESVGNIKEALTISLNQYMEDNASKEEIKKPQSGL